jgi:hypothetical protein
MLSGPDEERDRTQILKKEGRMERRPTRGK